MSKISKVEIGDRIFMTRYNELIEFEVISFKIDSLTNFISDYKNKVQEDDMFTIKMVEYSGPVEHISESYLRDCFEKNDNIWKRTNTTGN